MEIEAGVHSLGGACNIGVTTGKAFCGSVGKPIRREYCVVGDVVIMSARLMASKANVGQIFCDQATVSAVGQQVEFLALPPITVKSRVVPVPVFNPRRLISSTAMSTTFPLVLVGRKPELSALLASAQRLGGPKPLGTTVVVTGASGIGKSHLLRCIAAQISAPGFVEDARGLRPRVTVLFAASGPAVANGASMAVWVPVLRGCLGIDSHVLDLASISRQVDSFLDRHPPADPAVAKAQLEDVIGGGSLCREEGDPVQAQQVAACVHVVETAAKSMAAGLCVIVEDSQLLEADSWALISKLSSRLHASGGECAPLLLVLPMRGTVDQHTAEEHLLLQEVLQLDEQPDTGCLVELHPFSSSDVEELVRSTTAVDAVDADVTELMYSELLGVPQFTIEQLASLQLAGAFYVEDQHDAGESTRVLKLVDAVASRLALDVPYSLELRVTRGFVGLAPRCQLTVQTAAAIGRNFSKSTVVSAHPDRPSAEEVAEDIDAACRAGFLRYAAVDEDASSMHDSEFASNTVSDPAAYRDL